MPELAARPPEERCKFLKRFAETNDPGMRREILSPLIAPNNQGFFTSLGPLFRHAVFGRDSIKMAEDLHGTINETTSEIEHFEVEQLSRDVIRSLASLQGIRGDPQFSEERPGKIHHEYRNRFVNGKPVDEVVQNIITQLREEQYWMSPDSNKNELCYFGSVDSTPLYIRLVSLHAKTFGTSILEESITRRDGIERTITYTVARAADYLYDEIGRSPSGLLEFKRTNPDGLPSQSWKDSLNAFLHLDGTQANYDGGVAAIDVQGYAYDALIEAAALLAGHNHAPDWRDRASDLQRRTLQKLWLPSDRYFAQGLDYNDDGEPRLIQTITSDAGVVLSTRLLDDDPEKRKHIIDRLQSSEFRTEIGPRLRSLGHIAIENRVNYHGSLVVWPKETMDYMKGLERYSHPALADEQTEAIIGSTIKSRDFREYHKVSPDGTVQYMYDTDGAQTHDFKGAREAQDPQGGHGWTATAFIKAVSRRHARLHRV